jgi:hypothetical protein
MKHFIIISLLFIGCTGCLKNLNQTEYFRKLEIKKESWYDLVVNNRSAFETSIRACIADEVGENIEKITYWGEGRYACGKVVRTNYTDNEILEVTGVFIIEGQARNKSYNIRFVPKEGGELEEPILYYER